MGASPTKHVNVPALRSSGVIVVRSLNDLAPGPGPVFLKRQPAELLSTPLLDRFPRGHSGDFWHHRDPRVDFLDIHAGGQRHRHRVPPGKSARLTTEALEFHLVLRRQAHKFNTSPFPLDPSNLRQGNLQRRGPLVQIELQGEVMGGEEGCVQANLCWSATVMGMRTTLRALRRGSITFTGKSCWARNTGAKFVESLRQRNGYTYEYVSNLHAERTRVIRSWKIMRFGEYARGRVV